MGELLVQFDVIGEPKPQGSKRAMKAKHSNKIIMKESGVGFAEWRNAVSEAALRCKNERIIEEALDGPLKLVTQFRFRMPPSRPQLVKARKQAWHTVTPDGSKLVRLVEDSLQAAGLIKDDARFAQHESSKIETLDEWCGVRIRIETCGMEMP